MINGRNIGAAVSGGPDSVFMLYCLNNIKQELGINLTVLHFNHKIRKESDSDEKFTRELSERFNLNFASGSHDVKTYAKIEKLSLEDAARRKRYEFFKECRDRYKLDSIAIAHNKDDLAETFLMNLLRGSSPEGLSSMKPKREFYIRPILFIYKKEILDFLHEKNIPYKTDETNKSRNFTRNRIRLELIKDLEGYNKNIVGTIYREVEILRQENEFLNKTADKNIARYVKFFDKKAVIDVEKIHSDIALKRRIISRVCKKLIETDYSLSFNNIERIVQLKNKNKKVILRKLLEARLENGKLIIRKL